MFRMRAEDVHSLNGYRSSSCGLLPGFGLVQTVNHNEINVIGVECTIALS